MPSNMIPTTTFMTEETANELLIERLKNCSKEEKALLLETIENMPCKWDEDLNTFEFTLTAESAASGEHTIQKDQQPRRMTGYMRSGMRRKNAHVVE